jgi:hypothetical protein
MEYLTAFAADTGLTEGAFSGLFGGFGYTQKQGLTSCNYSESVQSRTDSENGGLGLKILGLARDVRVRFSSSAPKTLNHNRKLQTSSQFTHKFYPEKFSFSADTGLTRFGRLTRMERFQRAEVNNV